MPTHTLMGRVFTVVAEFEDSDAGTDAANSFMEAHPGVGVLEVKDGKIILADNSDRGIEITNFEAQSQ